MLSDCIFDLLNTTWLSILRMCYSCELLSDCIFDLLNTTSTSTAARRLRLWIAFRLYLWLIEHNLMAIEKKADGVVNCFQIVSLTYWTQLGYENNEATMRCELLSDCIFDLLNTTHGGRGERQQTLWIAFRLYLWLIEHNSFGWGG